MARIKLQMPDRFPYSTEMQVRISDLNYGGHVGNDRVLSLLHEARMRFLKQLGATELNAFGSGLIMTDAALEFKREMFYNDRIRVSMAVGDTDRTGFELFYRAERLLPDNKSEVSVLAKTSMRCYDYGAARLVAIPEALRSALNAL